MGERFIEYYKMKVNKEIKLAFWTTLIVGFLVHIYKFVNTLPHQDSLFNLYSSQNMVKSGRWFLSVACSFSSYFDLPWVNGFFSVLWCAVTSVIIIDIFKIKNRTLIVLTSSILVSFPAVTATLSFGYTADGYMFAMLLSALAVRLSLINMNKVWHIVTAICLVSLSCGAYQAYVSFALVLSICYLIVELFDKHYSLSVIYKWIGKQILIYGIGVIIYYITWKICLIYYGGGFITSYQGINQIGKINIHTINGAIYESIRNFLLFFIGYSSDDHRTLYAVLNCIFLLFSFVVLINVIIKSQLYKNKARLFLLILCIFVLPFAIYVWSFVSPGMAYSARMEQSICLIYILFGILCARWISVKVSDCFACLLVIIIFNNSITANLFYFYMDKCYEKSYATAVEMTTRIHLLDNGENKSILIIGSLEDYSSEMYGKPSGLRQLNVIKTVRKNLFCCDSTTAALFLANIIGMEMSYYVNNENVSVPKIELETDSEWPMSPEWECYFPLVDKETSQELINSSEVAEMGCWPAVDSVKSIDNVIVIKLSDVDMEE